MAGSGELSKAFTVINLLIFQGILFALTLSKREWLTRLSIPNPY